MSKYRIATEAPMVRICVEHLSRHHRFEDELFNQLEPYFFDQECELSAHYVEFFCWPEHVEEIREIVQTLAEDPENE